MDKTDCIVIGAGVVGLAVARRLAQAGREVLVLEAHPAIGMETSSRNSEVIHAGIYYAPGSLKATLCKEGSAATYAFCDEHGIRYERCGKLLVATHAQELERMQALFTRGQQAGLEVGELIWTGGDCHIYNNHLDQVREQLTREPREYPQLHLRKAASIFDYTFDDIEVEGYDPHPTIKAEVSV